MKYTAAIIRGDYPGDKAKVFGVAARLEPRRFEAV